MKTKSSKAGLLKKVLRDTFPILAGYIVLGMGFGVMMSANGYPIWMSTFMAVVIFAGSMQYAAVGMFAGGVSMLTVALTTLAINARHLFYGITLIDKYKNAGIRKPYMMFALTDETYSLVCSRDEGNDYNFLVSIFDHLYWITGCTIGATLGYAIKFNSKGIDFVLTALFITIFVDQWLKSKDHFPAIIGALITLIGLLIFGSENFLIPSMIGIAVMLVLKMLIDNRKEKKHADDERNDN